MGRGGREKKQKSLLVIHELKQNHFERMVTQRLDATIRVLRIAVLPMQKIEGTLTSGSPPQKA